MNGQFFSKATSHRRRNRRTPQTQIIFKSRLGAHNVGNDCRMTINGADIRILQKGIAKKGNAIAAHKYAGKSTIRYKLVINILVGNLVWIQGPYPVSKFTDIKIFNKVLRNFH